MSLGDIQTGAAFLSQVKVSTFSSQNIKALDGWMLLATMGKILEEDTIPNEFVSSQSILLVGESLPIFTFL